MPKRNDIHKVLLIGSGPIQIGQAAEFDFSGSQACKSLREEGIEVVLVNSNPATIMTDPDTADKVYIEPLVPEIVAKIIEKERPDGIIAGIGGQTGLNITSELAEMGILEKYNVEVLGTSVKSIREAEDRDLFKKAMQRVGEPVPRSKAVNTLDEALAGHGRAGTASGGQARLHFGRLWRRHGPDPRGAAQDLRTGTEEVPHQPGPPGGERGWLD